MCHLVAVKVILISVALNVIQQLSATELSASPRHQHRTVSQLYAWFPPFRCRFAVGGQPISVLVTSSLCIRKDVSSISVLTRNGNGSYGTEERQRNGGNQA